MYANEENYVFDTYHQYAFLRKADNEVILVVVNFSDKDVECGIRLSRHAFDYLDMPETVVRAYNIFSDDEPECFDLKADDLVKVKIKAYDGVAYKFYIENN